MSTQRWKARIAMAFLSRNQRALHLTESVSAEGVIVRTDSPPPAMTLLRVELRLPPDDACVVMNALITRTVGPRSLHAGVAVEVSFFAPTSEARQRWDDFLALLRENYHHASDRPVLFADESHTNRPGPVVVEGFRPEHAVPGGIFLATPHSFALGSDVRVRFVAVGGGERVVDCVVRRRVTGADAGTGLEYRGMTPGGWAELRAFFRKYEDAGLRAEVDPRGRSSLVMSAPALPAPRSHETVMRPPRPIGVWTVPTSSGWLEAGASAGPGE